MNIKFRDRKRFFIYTLRNSGKSGFETGLPDKIDLDEKLSNFLMDIQTKVKKTTYENYADNCDCILAIAETANSLDDLYLKIRSIFSNKNGSIILSSIHRSKGLQATNVYVIVNEDKLALTYGDLDGSQDKNLSYVALSRPVDYLYLVQ